MFESPCLAVMLPWRRANAYLVASYCDVRKSTPVSALIRPSTMPAAQKTPCWRSPAMLWVMSVQVLLRCCQAPCRLWRFLLVGGICCILVFPVPMDIRRSVSHTVEHLGDTGKEDTIPFPCQSKSCGCRSARQCLKTCCCHSLQYRTAWFRRYAPEVLTEWLSAESGTPQKPLQRACCEKRSATAGIPRRSEPAKAFASWNANSECQGLGGHLVTVPLMLISASVQTHQATVFLSAVPVSERLVDCSVDVPEPPPRIG